MPAKGQRTIWIDLLRMIGVFAVIVLHVAAVPATQFSVIRRDMWWSAHALDSLVRPCIPVFVMLSGALLLTRKDIAIGPFFRRRFLKVALPFLAWSAIYALWNVWYLGTPMSLAQFVHHLQAGMIDPVKLHLWFLPLILSLYLMVPILQPFVMHSSPEQQVYFAALWLVETLAIPFVQSRFGDVGYALTLVAGYVGYFVVGACLVRRLPSPLPPAWGVAAALLVVGGYAVTLWGTYVLTLRNSGNLHEYFYTYLSPSVIPMGVGAFLLLRDLGHWLQGKWAGSALAGPIAAVGEAALGIYLVHMLVLDVMTSGKSGFVLGPMTFHPALGIPLVAAIVMAVSLALTLLLQRSRILAWLVP